MGASEQGIVDPISGGDVRDRQDMFKGVGVDLKDPFEQFRKNKSHGFIARMKARDEMREKSKVLPCFIDYLKGHVFLCFLYRIIKFMIVTQLPLKVIDFEGFKFNDLKTKILLFDFFQLRKIKILRTDQSAAIFKSFYLEIMCVHVNCLIKMKYINKII